MNAGCLAFVALFIIAAIGVAVSSSSESTSQSGPAAKSPKEQVMDSLALEFTWNKAGFDNVMHANFTIRNNSSRAIRDVEIECEHSAPSGTRIDSNKRTIYEAIPAKSTKRVRNFSMGFIHSQVERSNCAIVDFVIG